MADVIDLEIYCFHKNVFVCLFVYSLPDGKKQERGRSCIHSSLTSFVHQFIMLQTFYCTLFTSFVHFAAVTCAVFCPSLVMQ